MEDAELRSHFERLENAMRTGFQRTDIRFAQIDDRFAQVDARFAQVDARFAQVDARLDKIDARLDKIDARFDQVDARFDHFAELMAGHFEYILTQIYDRLDRLEQRTP